MLNPGCTDRISTGASEEAVQMPLAILRRHLCARQQCGGPAGSA
jgi:hypothetical protein